MDFGVGVVQVQTRSDHARAHIGDAGIDDLSVILTSAPSDFLSADGNTDKLSQGNASRCGVEMIIQLYPPFVDAAILLLPTEEKVTVSGPDVRIGGTIRQLLIEVKRVAAGAS